MTLKDIHTQFPILNKPIRGKRLAYLDNAATTQKPKSVIDSLTRYYSEINANTHRGVHYLSEQATFQYEQTRQTVKQFINARDTRECVFVRSTTEAINLVADSFGKAYVKEGDEILISLMEHHSNIVPWQMLCQRAKAHLKIIPLNAQGELDLNALPSLLTHRTKLLALSHASNALGTLNPIQEIIHLAHQKDIPVLIDGAQSAPHLKIDVQALDCDFFTFSGHKVYGPTGIGVLYGKSQWLENMPPYQGGGDMILNVTIEKTIYNDIPYKFEAGTPAIAEVIALGTALHYLENIGFPLITQHENHLLTIATQALSEIPGIRLIGPTKDKIGVISFIMEGIHPHDIGTIVDQSGVAIRTGHHCAMPLMDFLGITATARASFGLYNTEEDIEQLVKALYEVKRLFKR